MSSLYLRDSATSFFPKSLGLSPQYTQWLYLERFGNGGTQHYSPFSTRIDILPKYQPANAKVQYFHIPSVWMEKTEGISIFLASSAPSVHRFVQENRVLMYVYPQFYDDPSTEDSYLTKLREKKDHISTLAIPSSSSRTIFVFPSEGEDPSFSVKVHCPYQISRFDRKLGKGTIQHCVTVSKKIKELMQRLKIEGVNLPFAILPEDVGVTFNGTKGWGYLVREITPWPESDKKRFLIPMFALYGQDRLDSDSDTAPTIIQKMIDRAFLLEGKEDKKAFATKFALEKIIFPIIQCFVTVYKETGILLELHGQNTLLELDDNGIPCRIVHRDLDDAVDLDILSTKPSADDTGFYKGQKISRTDSDKPKGSEQSIVYDKSIGRLNLDQLAQSLKKAYDISPKELETAAQEYFKSIFPEYKSFFPEDATVYRYADKMSSLYNSYDIVPIEDDIPRWRPS